MNYELAKQLKEAGFNNERLKGDWDTYFAPTLSELIEACGDSFESLDTVRPFGAFMGQPPIVGFIARSFLRNNRLGEGPTPEEAVALLYLSLHKNENN